MPRPFSRQQIRPRPILEGLEPYSRAGLLTCASSVCAQPSQVAPVTGFRLGHSLRAYSGGTVRDSHTIVYSFRRVHRLSGTLLLGLCLSYITGFVFCQYLFSKNLDILPFMASRA